MARERVQTRCDPATVEKIENHADEIDESKSESVRQLIRAGLAERGYQIAAADGMGTGQIDELANQLTEMERRRAARANQRQRLDVAQAVSLVAVLSYLIFVFGLGASGPLWTVVGVMAAVSTIGSYLWAFKLGGGADE